MYIRKKRNRSGSISVVVVDKSSGRYRELKTIGVSSDEKEIAALCLSGKKWISAHCGNRDMFALAERARGKTIHRIPAEQTMTKTMLLTQKHKYYKATFDKKFLG